VTYAATTHATKINAEPFDNHKRSLLRLQPEAHNTCMHGTNVAGNVPADCQNRTSKRRLLRRKLHRGSYIEEAT